MGPKWGPYNPNLTIPMPLMIMAVENVLAFQDLPGVIPNFLLNSGSRVTTS